MKTTNVMIVGVGGQGSILASKLLGHILISKGYDVKVSEVHGMSQRGGSVVTYIRYGDKVASPIIETGEADYIISFEKIEAARYVSFLAPKGKIIVNNREVYPMPVITGAAEYPHGVLEEMKSKGVCVDDIDALSLAIKAGTPKAVNIVLMGRLSKYFDFSEDDWINSLEQTVNPRFIEVNKLAFKLGREYK